MNKGDGIDSSTILNLTVHLMLLLLMSSCSVHII